MVTSVITPASKMIHVKTGTVARTDTTAKTLFGLPKGAVVLFSLVEYQTASDAGTSATVEVGLDADQDALGNGVSVKAAADRPTLCSGASVGSATSSDGVVTGIYAETGTASNTGGPFNISVFYTV